MISRYSRPQLAALFTDQARVDRWLTVEQAVLDALADESIAPAAAADALRTAGPVAADDVRRREDEIHHDLAAFVDVAGAQAPGASAWLHWGLTSSDVVDTALALALREAGDVIRAGLSGLREVVLERAREHRDTAMLGRTHGMPAEPITFGTKAAGWWHTLQRDAARLDHALEGVAVGKLSGAVGLYSGIPEPVERRALASLGLGVDPSATQVVQRDRHAALVAALAGIATSLERIALEVRHLQRSEVAEVAEPFAPAQKGSSAMPHKRNPIVAERICGLARVVRSHAQVAFENVALWHERDISHSSAERIIIPDALLVTDYMLDRTTWLVRGLVVDAARMARNLDDQRGLVASSRALSALVLRGVPRDEAYRAVQRAATRVVDGEAPDLAAALGAEPIVAPLRDSLGVACAAVPPPEGVAHVFARLERAAAADAATATDAAAVAADLPRHIRG